MTHAEPLVSFVIPVRNDAARLRRCLRSIAESAGASHRIEVIVADNGSVDGSADAARAEGAVVLKLAGLRVGALRNRAAAIARGRILAFVDADHEIVPGWIDAAAEVLDDPSVGGVGAPCRPPVEATWVQRAYDLLRRHHAGRAPVDWLGSGNLAVRRASFVDVGGFDTALETCEDVDLCRRMRLHGLTFVSDSRLGNIHYGDPGTLGDVFAGELWRGRDNLRVSLRAPRSGRTLATAAIPVLNAAAVVLIPAAAVTATTTGAIVSASAAAWAVGMIAARTALMLARGGAGRSPRLRTALQVCAVAAAYEAGRTAALVARAGHGRRRRSAAPAQGVA